MQSGRPAQFGYSWFDFALYLVALALLIPLAMQFFACIADALE